MQFKFLATGYERVLRWAKHPQAVWYLAFLSFIDSSLFPVSPLFMLIPMSFAQPNRAFNLASIVVVTSFIGGIVGYGLGFFAFDICIKPFIDFMGYADYYQMMMQWFQEWGFWAILFGCFAPFIPYKIFTIGAGIMQLNLGWFLLASAFGRTLRFLVIAAIIRWGGPKCEPLFRNFLIRISHQAQ